MSARAASAVGAWRTVTIAYGTYASPAKKQHVSSDRLRIVAASPGRADKYRGGIRRRGVHSVKERLKELILPVEQHLALVAEVPEEGALGQANRLRDLGGRYLLEPASGEQFERRRLQALSRTRLPTHHGTKFSDDSDCREGVW